MSPDDLLALPPEQVDAFLDGLTLAEVARLMDATARKVRALQDLHTSLVGVHRMKARAIREST